MENIRIVDRSFSETFPRGAGGLSIAAAQVAARREARQRNGILTAFRAGLCVVACVLVVPTDLIAKKPEARSLAKEEWHREARGFGATVVLTNDPEWKQKCSASVLGVPPVERTNAVRIGGKVWAVVLLSNPAADKTGNVDVTCDLRLVRPNGKISNHRQLRALRGKLSGPAGRSYLSEIGLTMVGEENDPLGEWVLELVVYDRNRGVAVPIVARYTLLPRGARQ